MTGKLLVLSIIIQDHFVDVFVLLIFPNTDLILTIVWVVLAFVGALFQVWRERGRAPFPPPPPPRFQQAHQQSYYESIPSSQRHSQQYYQQETSSGVGGTNISSGQEATETSLLLKTV